jgi:DNA-binding MarR family transcriptional regulator/GNAT superfamily N-acetyltransferase
MADAPIQVLADRVKAFRQFNRFFTRQIGVLREGLLHSPFPLTEARVLYELGIRRDLSAAQLCRDLGLDSGHVSRILNGFAERGLVVRERCDSDGRQLRISLTEAGRQAFAAIDEQSASEVAELLGKLTDDQQQRLLSAMRTIEGILDQGVASAEPFIIRGHQPGDMGWVVHRHGTLYFQEYGWDERFEALVAQIVADFINEYDPTCEHCWIAEVAGEVVGSVFLVKADETTAKLRLLLVEPSVRGMGLGWRLVQECIRFAKRTGYSKIILWTNSCLDHARRIYDKAGFTLVASEPHHSFGHDLVGENWELQLRGE